MRTLGWFLVLVGLIAGLGLSALLFQWDSVERAASSTAAEASASAPTGGSPATAPAGAASGGATTGASGAAATPVSQAAAGNVGQGAIQNGQDVYNRFCNGCHPNGKAGVGPALIGKSEATIKTAGRQGKGSMPGFGAAQISDAQLADLVAYVTSLK
ncbi:MAG: cytochrome c [Dehalococcoidia bacterium]|nr:cytochrome c [Dehalococcoidia bacterium]